MKWRVASIEKNYTVKNYFRNCYRNLPKCFLNKLLYKNSLLYSIFKCIFNPLNGIFNKKSFNYFYFFPHPSHILMASSWLKNEKFYFKLVIVASLKIRSTPLFLFNETCIIKVIFTSPHLFLIKKSKKTFKNIFCYLVTFSYHLSAY